MHPNQRSVLFLSIATMLALLSAWTYASGSEFLLRFNVLEPQVDHLLRAYRSALFIISLLVLLVALIWGLRRRHAGLMLIPTFGVFLALVMIAFAPQLGISHPTEGNPRAPVTITAFEDYHCTVCHYFSTDILPQLEEQYVKTGQVKIVFRHFVIYGQDSERAAQAAECVYEQDVANHTMHFRQFHELLFEHQGSIGSVVFTRDGLASLAQQAGVENLPAGHISATQFVRRSEQRTRWRCRDVLDSRHRAGRSPR